MLKKTVAASATLLALSLAPTVAQAAPSKVPIQSNGVYVTILSPTQGTSYDGSKQVEVSAFYQGSSNDGGVATLELYIDGRRAAQKQLDSPEARGVVSFLIDPSVLAPGKHQIVVRAAAADAEVNSASTSLSIAGNDTTSGLAGDASATPPQLFIASPAPETTVSGTVKIKVNAHDDSGKPPYVSLFIDHAFKTLRNYPPFAFDWDTTRVANGYHTIEVYGYNDAQQVGHAEPMRVMVNNPGGHTIVRHDLSDTAAKTPNKTSAPSGKKTLAVTPAKSASKAAHTALKPASPSAKHMVIKSGPLLAGAILSPSDAAQLPDNLPLLTDNEIAQVAAPDNDNQLSTVTPQARVTVKAQAQTNSPKKTTLAHPALTGAKSARTGQDLSLPQNLASNGVDQTPADGMLPQTELSSPFIHMVPAAPSTATGDAHSHGKPALAPAPKSGSVQMASAALQPDSLSPEELFDGSGKLEAPTLDSGKSLAMPTHRVIFAQSDGRHLIPLFVGGATNPQVLSRASGSYRVVFDTQSVALDRPVQMRGSILFAPFRQIFESQGGTLLWIPENQKVQAISPTRQIELTIGSRDALINNAMLTLDQAPYLLSGRTMVPLSFLPAALDVSVDFDAATGHLIINSNK